MAVSSVHIRIVRVCLKMASWQVSVCNIYEYELTLTFDSFVLEMCLCFHMDIKQALPCYLESYFEGYDVVWCWLIIKAHS